MNTTQPPHVVYLGLDDFPLGLAETQKVRLVARGLIEAGADVTVLSRWWGVAHWKEKTAIPPQGVFEGIPYRNASGTLVRPSSWLERKWRRIAGLANELRLLLVMRRQNILVAIVSTGTFSRIAYYRILSLLLRFTLVIHLVEYYSANARYAGWKRKLNARLVDDWTPRLADGVLPISQFLIDRITAIAPDVRWLKDPGLVDLSRFHGIARQPRPDYFLFCGYVGYMEIVQFILQAFEQSGVAGKAGLLLVLNGTESEFARFRRELGVLQSRDAVTIVSDLTDRELSQLYVDAYALLIPLRPTDQDRARFPHKIGEYCASSRPILTTAVGEVGSRFTHGVNAFVAPAYDAALFGMMMREALADRRQADHIGRQGREIAERDFDYRKFGVQMKSFLMEWGLQTQKASHLSAQEAAA